VVELRSVIERAGLACSNRYQSPLGGMFEVWYGSLLRWTVSHGMLEI